MKKLTIGILTVFMMCILILSGCGANSGIRKEPAAGKNGKKLTTIAASFYPIYIFTLNIAKDIPDVKVVDLTKPVTGCLHDYAVTPDDIKTLEDAQIFVISGAGMESFMDKVTGQIPDLKIVDSSEGIKLIKGQGSEGYNPHVWVSVSNAITQVKNIGRQLAVLDQKNAAKYKENTDAYVQKLEALRDKMHNTLKDIKSRDIITFHEAFPYFASEFNLNIAGVIEREPGSEPSAKELDDTIKKIKELNVKALFAEPQYSAKSAETIARETGAKVYTLDPVVTGPSDESEAENAYISIMENNLKTLQEALK